MPDFAACGPAALGRLGLPGLTSAMDAAYYEDLAGRLYGLLIGLEDRLKREDAQQLHHFIDVGEYGLAVEEIAGALAQTKAPITDQERGDLLALALRMKLDDLVARAEVLPACRLASAIYTKVESSLIMRLSCGYTLKSPQGARTFWLRVTSSVSAGHPQCTVKIVTNRG
jgi:hypothetical protein